MIELDTDRLRFFDAYRTRLEADDPVAFCRRRLGVEPWERQAEILRAVADHPRVTVRSGHKTGKSLSIATLALWWYATRPSGARAIITSSTSRQVREIVWREVQRLYRGAKTHLGGEMHELPSAGLRRGDGTEIFGFSTDSPERMAGLSGPDMLFLVDEASGVEQSIFEAIEGNRAGGARIAMFSNPTQTSGYFWDSFNGARDYWHTIHVSSEETPNATGKGKSVPGLATREWIAEKRQEWGEQSPLYAVRVRGDFPTQSENAIVGLQLVDEARRRWLDCPGTGRLHLGVDVARFGDDETVIFPRRGRRALEPLTLRSMDTVDVAGHVLALARQLRNDGERPLVKVDSIGIGAGVCDVLSRQKDVELVEINVSERATAEGYARLRDQLWFACRDWLREGGAIPADDRLAAELVAPVYKFDAQGRHVVEPKDRMKERLGRSPDRADALCMAIYEPPSPGVVRCSEASFMDW